MSRVSFDEVELAKSSGTIADVMIAEKRKKGAWGMTPEEIYQQVVSDMLKYQLDLTLLKTIIHGAYQEGLLAGKSESITLKRPWNAELNIICNALRLECPPTVVDDLERRLTALINLAQAEQREHFLLEIRSFMTTDISVKEMSLLQQISEIIREQK